jgi:L-histidine Nalpha-methyltransferase / hercynylcysteine S-oxide synthase
VTYYGLDLERNEIEHALTGLQEKIGSEIKGKIVLKGLWGTYDDAFRVIRNDEFSLDPKIPIHFLFLGNTIANFSKGDSDVAFLKSLPLKIGRGDKLILGLDRMKPAEEIERAYEHEEMKPWKKNGLYSAGRLFGDEALFKPSEWELEERYNEKLGKPLVLSPETLF